MLAKAKAEKMFKEGEYPDESSMATLVFDGSRNSPLPEMKRRTISIVKRKFELD